MLAYDVWDNSIFKMGWLDINQDKEYNKEELVLEVPGIKKEDIFLHLENSLLTIKYQDRFQRKHEQVYRLKPGVEPEAQMSDGLLTILLKNPHKLPARLIEIK